MREKTGIKFLDELFAFLDDAIDSGAEVHIVDHSDPDHVKEHVFNGCDDEDEDDFGPDDIEGEVDDDLPFADDDICPYDGDCDECPYEEECAADLASIPECDCEGHCEYCRDDLYDTEPDMWGIPDIDRVIFSDPATIVFWADGEKTVVKTCEHDRFEPYVGFAMACMKKMFGSTSRAKSVMEYFAVEQDPKAPKKERGLRVKVNPIDDAVGIDHETIMEAVDEALNG